MNQKINFACLRAIVIVITVCATYKSGIFVKAHGTLPSGRVTPRLSHASKGQELTGNWAVKNPRPDGTVSKQYFNLRQEGDKIRGTIRSTQFFYSITDSTGDANAFSITAAETPRW